MMSCAMSEGTIENTVPIPAIALAFGVASLPP